MEKLDFLITYLLNENKNNGKICIPQNLDEKKRLYRSLCNIRQPSAISEEYIKIEDEFLKEESIKNKIMNLKDISLFFNYKETQIGLWKGDITSLKIDAIVNAANSKGLGCFVPCHKCIDNAIHYASGVKLRLECDNIMKKIGILKTGEVVITNAYNLPSKYIIHTVGPIIYKNVTQKEILELKKCYINSLEIAKKNNIKNVAFPCISTGEFRFPKELASKIAIEAVKEYIDTNEEYFEKIIFNVFSEEDYRIYLKNLGEYYGKI